MTWPAYVQVRIRRVVTVFILITLTASPRAPAQQTSGGVSFLPSVIYPSGGYSSQAVAVGDFNGDGKPDLAIANFYYCNPYPTCTDGVVGVLLGNGDGTFRPAVGYDTGGSQAVSVAVADVNGDGRLDLVVANQLSDTVAVLLGNGDGTFQPAVTYNLTSMYTGTIPDSVTVADVNGDGRPDLVVAMYGTQVEVLLGNGDGTFQPPVIYGQLCCGTGFVAVADVNGDGKPDLVVAKGNGSLETFPMGAVSVMLGNGDGSFQPEVDYLTGGLVPTAVDVRDVNGDGKPDLLVANDASAWTIDGFPSGPGSASVLLGNGDGTFQPAVLYPSGGPNYRSIAVGDVNGDGKLDLLLAACPESYCGSGGDGLLAVLLGNGDGTFQPATFFDSGSVGAVSIAVADLNHDGRLDVALANWFDGNNYYSASVGVLLNNSPYCTTPPVVTLALSPTTLSPPNGAMVPVQATGTITDTDCAITSASFAVKDKYGKVQPSGPVTVGSPGTYSFIVSLQASIVGGDSGRLYTMTVTATNRGGKSGSKSGTVVVPPGGAH